MKTTLLSSPSPHPAPPFPLPPLSRPSITPFVSPPRRRPNSLRASWSRLAPARFVQVTEGAALQTQSGDQDPIRHPPQRIERDEAQWEGTGGTGRMSDLVPACEQLTACLSPISSLLSPRSSVFLLCPTSFLLCPVSSPLYETSLSSCPLASVSYPSSSASSLLSPLQGLTMSTSLLLLKQPTRTPHGVRSGRNFDADLAMGTRGLPDVQNLPPKRLKT